MTDTGADESRQTADTTKAGAAGQSVDPALADKIVRLRSKLRESFGMAAMALMAVPRYRDQTLADLQHVLMDPMLNDRVAIAYPGKTKDKPLEHDLTGFVIWASVTEEVDAKIREQIKSGVFPVRLKANEWNCGPINWIFDIIAADKQTAASVIGNFRSVAKGGELRLHPLISRLVEPEVLEKLGGYRSRADAPGTADGAD